MTAKEPTAELVPQFSSDGAVSTPWTKATEILDQAEIYWLSTVRPDGRPHVTPLVAVFLDGSMFFCTGAGERKAKNLVDNSHCIITTGCNKMSEGLYVVIEGDAVRITGQAKLGSVAEKYASKYDWHYDVRNGEFHDGDTVAKVFEVVPTTGFGFGKGEPFSQTRWRF
jgi:general stress protein 26